MEKTENIETALDEVENLVKQMENSEAGTVENLPPQQRVTKRHAQKHRGLAAPHLRAHKVNGHDYYYYVRGSDPEIYLGDAETILSWKPGEAK